MIISSNSEIFKKILDKIIIQKRGAGVKYGMFKFPIFLKRVLSPGCGNGRSNKLIWHGFPETASRNRPLNIWKYSP